MENKNDALYKALYNNVSGGDKKTDRKTRCRVDSPYIIAIDGRAASGKTTLAGELGRALGASVIHMDDFFLPLEKRTPERLSEPGGNVDYERFFEEVLSKLKEFKAEGRDEGGDKNADKDEKRGRSFESDYGHGCGLNADREQNQSEFTYRRFDCSTKSFKDDVTIDLTPVIIVEGSYSHHPYFGDYADMRIFKTIDRDEQWQRILKRNGAEWGQDFKDKWIPMEEKYFDAFGIEKKADVVI